MLCSNIPGKRNILSEKSSSCSTGDGSQGKRSSGESGKSIYIHCNVTVDLLVMFIYRKIGLNQAVLKYSLGIISIQNRSRNNTTMRYETLNGLALMYVKNPL